MKKETGKEPVGLKYTVVYILGTIKLGYVHTWSPSTSFWLWAMGTKKTACTHGIGAYFRHGEVA